MNGEAVWSSATSSHLQRMSAYCALLGEQLGLDGDVMRVAARLHDIGMAAVSPAIVTKPGPLTREERRELQEHPELGRSFVYPGEAALYNGTPWRISRRAPLIGEDNVAVLCDELGLSRGDLSVLAENGVV